MKHKIILITLIVCSIMPTVFAQRVLLSDDSLRYVYAEYKRYSPPAAEVKDYYKLKYHLSWLLLDESLIAENIEALNTFESISDADYNESLTIPLNEMPFEKINKIIPLADKLIQAYTKDKKVMRPLLLSKIMLLDKQGNYVLLKESLSYAFNSFADNVTVINKLKQIELATLFHTGEVQKAISLGAAYYRESKSNELLQLHFSHLFHTGAYDKMIDLAEIVKKANLMDCFFGLGKAYQETGDYEHATQLFELIYSNVNSRVEEEIRLSKLQLDTNVVVLPEAILHYTEAGNNNVFFILPPEQLKSMADYFNHQKNFSRACDFYRYTILNINAKLNQQDWEVRYQESEARLRASFNDYKRAGEQANKVLRAMKDEVIRVSKKEPGCTIQIM